MSRVYRCDYAKVKATINADGFLVDSPVVARTGIQEYRNDNGSIRRELRLPEEVFKADSLAGYAAKPITFGHPEGKKVTTKNFKKYAVGTVTSAGRQDGNGVVIDVVVNDDGAIESAKSGRVADLSAGYTCDLDETPGVWEGQKYDAIQRNIAIDHVAMVKKGRAGVARLNIDGDEEEVEEMADKTLSRVRLDSGLEYEAAPEVVVELERLRNDAALSATNVETANAQIEKLAAERDTFKARVDGFDAELKKARIDAVDEATKNVAIRSEIIAVAEKHGVKCDGLTDREVREAVIKEVRGDSVDLKDKTDAYIDAAFDMAAEAEPRASVMSRQRSAEGVRKTGKTGARNDSANVSTAEEHRLRMIKRMGER